MPKHENKQNGKDEKNSKIKYKYEISNKEFFINPYTFLERNKKVNREENEQVDRKEKNTKNKEIKHFSYPFFRLGDNPVIPGSSIRGPLRSVYEALTDSCYSTTRSGQYITARTKSPFLPGLLIKTNGKWELYSATRYLLPIKEYGARPFDNGKIFKYKEVIDNHGGSVYFEGDEHTENIRGRSILQYRVLHTSIVKKPGYE